MIGFSAPTLYRNRVAWLVVTVFFDFLFLLTLGLALNTSAPAAGRAAGAVIAFVTAMWLVWAYRCGMVCDEHGVTVRQYSGRRVGVPWTHVAGFRLDRPMSVYGGGEWISLVLDDGRVVRSQNLCALAAGRDWARHVVEELEAQRRTHE